MPKIAVVSCITCLRDQPRPVPAGFTGAADFFLYTDRKYPEDQTTGWTVRPIKPFDEDPARTCRRYKYGLPELFLGYEARIWQDASLVLQRSPEELVAHVARTGHPVASFAHRERSCVYDEAEKCHELYADIQPRIDQHVRDLRVEGYPERYGLHETTLLVLLGSRGNLFAKEVWDRLCRGSRRDQLSFDPALWKLQLTCCDLSRDWAVQTPHPYVPHAEYLPGVPELQSWLEWRDYHVQAVRWQHAYRSGKIGWGAWT